MQDSVFRAPVAAASVVAVVAHVPVTGEHLRELPYIGVLFVALEIGYLVLAAALCWRPARGLFLASAALSAAALVALLCSRTVGLPLLSDDIGNWNDPLVLVSLIAEWVVLIGGITASSRTVPRSQLGRVTSVSVGVAMLTVGIALVGIASPEREAAPSDPPSEPHGMDMGLARFDLGVGRAPTG